MMKLKKCSTAALAVSALTLALMGCQKQEGPAETAGKKIDKAVQKTKEGFDEAAEKAGEKIEKAGEKIEKAGDEVKDAVKGD